MASASSSWLRPLPRARCRWPVSCASRPSAALDQGAVGVGDAGGLALAAVHAVHAPRAAVFAGGVQPCAAVFAGAVAVGERGHHHVPRLDGGHLRAGLLDHAQELVAHLPRVLGQRLGLVGPQIAAADSSGPPRQPRPAWFRAAGSVGRSRESPACRGPWTSMASRTSARPNAAQIPCSVPGTSSPLSPRPLAWVRQARPAPARWRQDSERDAELLGRRTRATDR